MLLSSTVRFQVVELWFSQLFSVKLFNKINLAYLGVLFPLAVNKGFSFFHEDIFYGLTNSDSSIPLGFN